MASFKITDLTELASGSVNDSDVLEIVDLDADESKKVTIASLKNVFTGEVTAWGDITGTLSSQTDLQSALDGKLNTTALIDDLSDVDAASPSNGQALIFNSTSGNWESSNISDDSAIWGNISGTLSSQSDLQIALNAKLNTTAVIDDLSNVDAPTPSNGESLIYNATSGNWEANTISTSTTWGSITGTLSSQTDLQSALNGKLNTSAVINDLSDIDAATPSNGQILIYNSVSGNWENGSTSATSWGSITGTLSSQTDLQSALNAKLNITAVIDDLSDVDASAPSNGEALIYNSTSGNWESNTITTSTAWGDITGTLSSQTDLQSALNGKLDTTAVIDDLSDVSAPSPSNGQSLVYNSTSGNWEANTVSTSTAWGDITGTLSSQSDLQSALNGKLDTTAVIDDLSDVNAPTPSNGEALVYNSLSGNWESSVISASVSWGSITGTLSSQTDLQSALDAKLDTTAVINDLSDVNAPTPSNGQTLIYNSTSGNWENGSASGGVSIGDSIGGATNNAVLFVNGSGVLAQNSKFTFNGTTLNFTGGSSSSTSNSSYGVSAGNSNFGSSNTSIGYLVNSNATGSSMTSIGRSAGQLATSNESAFIGYEAGYQSNGNRTIYAGYRSGRGNTGASCVGIGDYTLYNGNGINNTAVGQNSQNSSTGTQNTSIGARSLLFGNSNYSTGLGYQAGQSNTGNYVLALGYNAGNSNSQANRLIVGQQNLPQFAGAAAAAAALPASGANGVYLYWDTTDNTIKARP